MKKTVFLITLCVLILTLALVFKDNGNEPYLNKTIEKNLELEIIKITKEYHENQDFMSNYNQGEIVRVNSTLNHKFENEHLDLDIIFFVDEIEYRIIADGYLEEYKAKGKDSLYLGNLEGHLIYPNVESKITIDYRAIGENDVLFISLEDENVLLSLNKSAFESHIEDIDFDDYNK